jgi:hypothetical protein
VAFPLVECETIEPPIPDDVTRRYSDIPPDSMVRLTSAGRYYTEWLVADVSYIECVIEDTLLPSDIAQRLVTAVSRELKVYDYVDIFLDFLEEKETEECLKWRYKGTCRPFVHELRRRLREQEDRYRRE